MISSLKVDQLQDAGGNNLVTSNGSGVITAAGFGKIGQVKQTTSDVNTTIATTSFTELTEYATTITPSSTSSKILIMAAMTGGGVASSSNVSFRLRRNSTDIALSTTATGNRQNISFGALYQQDDNTLANANFQFLDSPATISEITYRIMAAGSNTTTARINATANDNDQAYGYRAVSTLTLMEILP